MRKLQHLFASLAARCASRRLPKAQRRQLSLGEHFMITACVAVLVLAPVLVIAYQCQAGGQG